MIYHNNIKFLRLSYFKHHLKDEFLTRPNKSGIYYWVYWPKFDENTISANDLIDRLKDFTTKNIGYSESFKGKYKFEGNIHEQKFRDNGNLFGLPNKKNDSLKSYLSNRNGIIEFSRLFKELCFARPVYIGKANNLPSRLSQHFNYKSEVVKNLEDLGIKHTQIWVGYRIINDGAGSNMNVIFEEIFSRALKPGLTKKPN